MITSAAVLSVLAVLLGAAAGLLPRFQLLAWRAGWACVAGLAVCLIASLLTT